MNLLDVYVHAWSEGAEAIDTLLSTLDEADWSTPTDCPGWTVKDVVAHLAHLEHELATGEVGTADPALTAMLSDHTEAGVDTRRGHTGGELQTEFAEAVALRTEALKNLPADPQAMAPSTPGGISWSWDTLLRNRVIDVWVHEQDIRRAVGRPGGLDSAGAQVTTTTFRMAMPFVIGKKVRPAPGTTVRWNVTGEIPFDLIVAVDDDGRAKPVESIEGNPTVSLAMTSEAFTVLGAGRRKAERLDITIVGYRELAASVLSAMPVTF